MINKIYAVRDVKVGFGTPLIFQSDAIAMRAVAASARASDSMLAFAPKDFSLYRLGIYDDDTGLITCDDVPTHISDLVDLIDVSKDGV